MRQKKSVIFSIIVTVFLLLCACNATEETEAHDHPTEEPAATNARTVLEIDETTLKEFKIELATAEKGRMEKYVSMPGEIIVPPDNLAHIHPRFAGIVKDVRKHIGDKVKKGDVLAVLESNESLAEYKIKSLIDGTVIEKHFSLGEVVEGADHGFVVANLNEVWAMLQVYQKNIPFLQTGQPVTVSAGENMPQVRAKINYISPIIDEVTRTAAARVVLQNTNGAWKPGLFVTGKVVTSKAEVAIRIPNTALQTLHDETVVFVQTAEGFTARDVYIGRTNQTHSEITDGLKAGEIYVKKGGFTLKAELQKSGFGDGHGH